MIKIGISQINNHFEIENNLESILRAIKFHAKSGVDLVFFPECALTGYNTGILKADKSKILAAVAKIQKFASDCKINVALPTPWANEGEGFLNSVLLISDSGEIVQSVHKIGLQKGEERLFVPGDSHKRIFEVKGHKIGVIICIETSHEPWAYLKESDRADLIFWPGFYASTEEEAGLEWSVSKSGSAKKVRDNLIDHWRVPLIHVNCSSSPEAQYWPGKLFGGSSAYDRNGENLFLAKRAQEELAVLEFNEGKLTSVRSELASSLTT